MRRLLACIGGGLLPAILLGVVGGTYAYAAPPQAVEVTPPTTAHAASKGAADAKRGARLDDVVVYVGGTPITAGDVEQELSLRIPKATSHGVISAERTQQHLDDVVRELVMKELVFQAAVKSGVSVTDDEMQAARASILGRFTSPEMYQAALAREGLDEATIEAGLKRQILQQKMMNRVLAKVTPPTESELRKYYDEHPDKFRIPAQANVSYLMVPVDPSSDQATWEEAKVRLEAFKELIQGGEPYEAVRDSVKESGGAQAVDLGLVHQGQPDMAEVDRVAFSLKEGEVSDPVRTLYGYALIYVSKQVPPRKLSFEQLNRDLFEKEWLAARRQQTRDQWLSDLVEQAELKFTE